MKTNLAKPHRHGVRCLGVAHCERLPRLLVVASGLVAAMYARPAAAAPETPGLEATELRREGDRVILPTGSTYRDRLVVRPVEKRVTERTIAVPAQVEADPSRVYNVLPPLGGRVLDLKVGLGDHVVKGQMLFSISSGDMAQATADLAKANSQAAMAHKALDRARGLTKAGGGSVKDLESAANDAAQADSEAARARNRLDTISGGASSDAGRTFSVTAPADGVVTALSTAAGAYINDATQSMMTITNLDEVWVTANIPEGDLGAVSDGQSVDLAFTAYPGVTLHGKVLFIGPVTEPDTRRTKVRIRVPDASGKLKPNMFATARLRGPATSSLAVPDSALLMNNETTSVFVETAPWTFERRDVETGYDADGVAAVTRGLESGERVVVRGGVLLND